jgi:hypothetical protein
MTDIQGWYQHDNESDQVRVRLTIAERGLMLHTLADGLVAHWSLDHLENLSVPVIGREWVLCDGRLQVPTLTLENDDDYVAIQRAAPDLVPLRRRRWHQLAHAVSLGNSGSLMVLVIVLLTVGYLLLS